MIGWLTKLVTGGGDREIKRLLPTVEKINALEPDFQRLSDAQLRDKTAEFRERLGIQVGPSGEVVHAESNGKVRESGNSGQAGKRETLEEILPEAFAAVREASRRTIGLRHFDVQLIGGIVLHQGKIAEMKTGEGKTLVASLPLYLNALLGRGAHLVTPNDYLARVGGGWMGPVYHALGMSVGMMHGPLTGVPTGESPSGIYDPSYVDPVDHGDERLMHWRPVTRQEAYRADITYGTNNEFGFDYLRDNMEMDLAGLRQRELYFAIVDEVDSILIDEARTPLIISGPADEPPDTYYKFAQIVSQLQEETDYTVDLKMRSVLLTDEGIAKVERLAGVDNIYGEQNYHLVHYLEQALKAKVIFRRDREYVLVKDGRVLGQGEHARDADVVIVDEFTGRLMAGRRYSEGLHQAIEAKEGVTVQRENLTYATITFQNYFRLYEKLAGMTGTAATEAEEFRKIYNLEVVTIPTNRPMIRLDAPDLIYKTEEAKLRAIVEEIEELHEAGRPVLVGTTSVEKSERLSAMLKRSGVPHRVLNAKMHEQEASIVAQAGRKGGVTIATNMAGRGTDIILGGNPPDEAEAQAVRQLGGLHIIGSERHEARRIDNQLRGRAGRQGDPGSSRFYLSLEDDLMRRFGSDRIAGLMERLGLEDDQPIEHALVTKSIETAQQKVEGYNFDLRKHTVEYDDVMNRQREVIYGQRHKILEAEDLKPIVLDVVRGQLERLVAEHTDSPRHEDWDLEGLYAAVTSMFGAELSQGPEAMQGLGREELLELLYGWAEELYEAKEQAYSPELMRYAARVQLLRIIDGLWVEHLTAIDDMIAGIGLRAYGQRDPLTEYKGEAYRMFQNLLAAIQANLANAIFRVEFVVQPLAQAAPAGAQAPAAGGETSGGDGAPSPAAAGAVEAQRAAALAASSARRLTTNRPPEGESLAGAGTRQRPVVEDGRVLNRAERRRRERDARRHKSR
ncbi:MAG TPA: preprotein translocase subunit SecA [Chloroflexota bacterium]|nr:preprotein translocase subunit SecA [Chloroflexota bacterium]